MAVLRACFSAVLALAIWATPAGAGPLFRCTAAVVVNDELLFLTPGLATLDVDVDYPAPTAEVLGSGAGAQCELGPLVKAAGAQPTFFDDDQGSVSIRFEGPNGIPSIAFSVAVCRLLATEELMEGDFSVSVNEALFPDGSSTGFTPVVGVGDVTCVEAGPTTTTTTSTTTSSTTSSTTSTSSTTTLPGAQRCADADGNGAVTSSDCLTILRDAVMLEACETGCVCDPSGDGVTTANDGLICLRAATSLPVVLACNCG